MTFIDKLTGKHKVISLEKEIHYLKQVILEKENSLDNLLKQRIHLSTEIDYLQNEVLDLKSQVLRNEELLTFYCKQYNEIKEAIDDSQINLKREISKREEAEKLIARYQNAYGNMTAIKEEDKEKCPLEEYDSDYGFFTLMQRKNDGNPFNDDQIKAIRENHSHLRILAGAGSGKTQTICAKAVYLNAIESVDYRDICMITFTRKAADEMLERVDKFADNIKAKRMTIGTFNGIFNKLLREMIKNKIVTKCDMDMLNIIPPKNDINDYNYINLLSELIKQHELEEFQKDELKDENGSIKDRIDFWITLDYNFDQIRESVSEYDDKYRKIYEDRGEEFYVPISQRMYNLLNEFQVKRKEGNIFVYNDHITNIRKALSLDKVREYLHGKFRYIIVDEFQDTNQIQINILKLIVPPDQENVKLIIVGDPNQSIYAFRGSSSQYIQDLDKVYDGMKTANLMKNYRSNRDIVQKANKLISFNSDNKVPPMECFHSGAESVFVKSAKNSNEEAELIIDKILRHPTDKFEYICQESGAKIADEKNPNFTKFVVLYRGSHQIQVLLKHLYLKNIPFIIDEEYDLSIFNNLTFLTFYKSWEEILKTSLDSLDKLKYFAIKNSIQRFLNQNYISNKEIKALGDEPSIEQIQILIKEKCKKGKKHYAEYIENYHKYYDLIENIAEAKLNDLITCIMECLTIKDDELEAWKKLRDELSPFEKLQQLIEWKKEAESRNADTREKIDEYSKKRLNALYLLTIHKSKGLAFENVFIPGCYKNGFPSHRAQNATVEDIEKAKIKASPITTVEEERRLMYVALTRGKNMVFASYPLEMQGNSLEASGFIREMMK